jgi:hypothetical protein
MLALLLSLSACNLRTKRASKSVERPSKELVAIDSLMWQQPDSALVMLLDYLADDDRAAACHVSTNETFDGHYANLLLSELLYKNDFAQTNRMELQQAMAYFDSMYLCTDVARNVSNSNAFLTARTHYINGVGYYENDSVVAACREYLTAVKTMENHFMEKELMGQKAKFMALAYTHLTGLYSDQYLHEQAIYFGKISLGYYNKFESSYRHMAWILDEIGLQYEMKGVFDSAAYYYRKGMNMLADTNNLSYRDLASRLAFLSYVNGKDAAFSLGRLRSLVGQAESQREYLARCLTIGEIYYHEKQFDSTRVYLNKVFNDSPNISAKKQAAEWLVKISKTQDQNVEISEYASFLLPFANQEENNSALKSQLTEFYKNFVQENLKRQHLEKIRRNTKWTTAIIICFLFVIITIALFYHKKKQGLEVQIEEEKHAHEIKQKAISGRLKKSNETLREALKRLEEQETQNDLNGHKDENHTSASGQERYEVFKQSPICQIVFDKVNQLHADKKRTLKSDMNVIDYKTFALSATQLALISKTVVQYFPELYASLKAKHPSLNQKDWMFCILYFLQLDKLSICVLLQESYHTCRRYTLKLEKIFDCQHGLTAFLLEQVDALNI